MFTAILGHRDNWITEHGSTLGCARARPLVVGQAVSVDRVTSGIGGSKRLHEGKQHLATLRQLTSSHDHDVVVPSRGSERLPWGSVSSRAQRALPYCARQADRSRPHVRRLDGPRPPRQGAAPEHEACRRSTWLASSMDDGAERAPRGSPDDDRAGRAPGAMQLHV